MDTPGAVRETGRARTNCASSLGPDCKGTLQCNAGKVFVQKAKGSIPRILHVVKCRKTFSKTSMVPLYTCAFSSRREPRTPHRRSIRWRCHCTYPIDF